MTVVEKHPQRQQIIDGILSGQTLRQIAACLSPKIGVASLGRFRLRVIVTAGQHVSGKGVNSRPVKDLVKASAGKSRDMQAHGVAQESVKRGILERVEARRSERAKWITNAATVGEDGQLNHRALASHDRNDLTTLELEARLAGLLTDRVEHDVRILAVSVNLPAADEAATEQAVIDVTPHR